MAGLCAAISAKEAGADRVLILEKGPLIGGHSLYSSGSIAAFAPKRADGAGGAFHDSPESFLADALAAGGGSGNRAILQRIVKESGAGLDWLEGMGITFGAPFQAHSGLKPRSFAMRGNSAGRSYILALAMRAQSLGITIAMNARVVHIERERASSDSGGVPENPLWSLEIKTDNADKTDADMHVEHGEQGVQHVRHVRRVRARSIVLATGGFAANVERRRRILPMLGSDVMTTANPEGKLWEGADGDGIDLAMSVGGRFLEGFGLQLLPYWGGRLLDYAGGDIYVDGAGRRFVNEASPWVPIAEKILALPGKTFWVITDRKSAKGATLGMKLMNGAVRKAATIEEMADAMHVPFSVLAKTLRDYNDAARKGFDPLTGKTVFTQTIDEPPFYFGKEHIYVHTTLDGIATDDCARVIDGNDRPIPGLYAAGELVGGVFGRDRLGGAGLANCLVMGRAAGREAAAAAGVMRR